MGEVIDLPNKREPGLPDDAHECMVSLRAHYLKAQRGEIVGLQLAYETNKGEMFFVQVGRQKSDTA